MMADRIIADVTGSGFWTLPVAAHPLPVAGQSVTGSGPSLYRRILERQEKHEKQILKKRESGVEGMAPAGLPRPSRVTEAYPSPVASALGGRGTGGQTGSAWHGR